MQWPSFHILLSPILSALEPRILTLWDMHKYAREAYKAGIRFIGGCCGFEPDHIRALAQELAPERGIIPAGSDQRNMECGVVVWRCTPSLGSEPGKGF